MSIKRIIAVLLVILMLAPAVISCANNQQTPDSQTSAADTSAVSDTSDAGTSETSTLPPLEIPKTDYDGYPFHILTGIDETYAMRRVASEELTGEAINDAFYNRNLAVEEMLNIKIEQIDNNNSGNLAAFKTSVTAGDNAYDCVFLNFTDSASAVTGGSCLDLNKLPYVDLEKPWWNRDSIEQLSILGKTYMVGTDLSVGDKDVMWVLFFDKERLAELKLENPYQLVADNKWTFAKFYEMMQKGLNDVNGDGKYTVKDNYGLLTHAENYCGLWSSAGESLFKLDGNKEPVIAWGSERFANVWDIIVKIMGSDATYGTDIGFISSGLRDGRALFATEVVAFIRAYRENEREFGILPMPKFDENQDRYYTYVAVNSMLMLVGKNVEQERTGEILEALAAKGREIILPAYYDVSLKSKYSRDEESSASLDIIFENRMYDLGLVYSWGGVINKLKSVDANIASVYASSETSSNKAIQKTLEKIAMD